VVLKSYKVKVESLFQADQVPIQSLGCGKIIGQ